MYRLSFKIGLLFFMLFNLASEDCNAQIEINKRTWLSGYARSILAFDNFTNTAFSTDSLTAKKLNSGHTLVDLEANIQPNKNLFIHGSVRIRNDHGGFWNSGVTFDVRNLYIRGVAADAVRFQLGDVQYKLTPYTFFNDHQEFYDYMPEIFREQTELIHQDLFFDNENTWRQQGFTTDFGFSFKNILEEINVNAFALRLRPSFAAPAERLFMGGHIDLIQSKNFSGQINYVNTFDWEGTRDPGAALDVYNNPVLTAGAILSFDINNFLLKLETEAGRSFERKVFTADSLETRDFFVDASLSGEIKNWKVKLNFRDVGPDFRSAAAQTRRISFNESNRPNAFSEVAVNDSVGSLVPRSLSIFDMMREGQLYNSALQQNLMITRPEYNNIDPFGSATPNRRMISANFIRIRGDKNWDVNLGVGIGNEIRGQGTTEKRAFTEINLDADYLLEIEDSKLLNSINFNLKGWIQNTTRSGSNEFEQVDLQSTMASAGVRFNLPSGFNLNTAYMLFNSKGNETITERSALGEIRNYTPVTIDHNEQLIGIGLGYDFTTRNTIDFYYNRAVNTLSTEEDYQIDNFTLLFKMKF